MTPQPARYAPHYPREQSRPAKAEPSLKVEAVKYLLAMVVAALTAYFATVYAIKEEVAILKVRLEYMREKVDAQTRAIDSLTAAVNAHVLAHKGVVIP
jgi:hypothetical protein